MKSIDLSLIPESFFLTILMILILCPIAKQIGLIDSPCSRKKHSGQIPLIGGIAIYLCFVILSFSIPDTNFAYLIAITLIVVCGVIDDYKFLSYKIRLSVEAVAAVVMISWGNVEITELGNLFGFGSISLGYFSSIFTIFAVIGGINAFNMIDGIDGLAASLSILIFVLLFTITYNTSNNLLDLFLIFIPSITAFLVFNGRFFGRKNASIFLGDTGSMLFGFTICWIVISVSQGENRAMSPVSILWIIALPLLDTVSIMVRRIKKGGSALAADREHFHHILPVAGYTVNQTVSIILLLALFLGVFGIIGEKYLLLPEWVMFGLFLSVFALHYWGMNHAWKIMKIIRYIREYKKDRRKNSSSRNSGRGGRRMVNIRLENGIVDRRKTIIDRRQQLDRRYQHIDEKLLQKHKDKLQKKIA